MAFDFISFDGEFPKRKNGNSRGKFTVLKKCFYKYAYESF